jgi:two-component system sensor histidine kinase DctS
MLLKSFSMKPAPTLNFELFDLVQRQASALNRRAMTWLVGLLLLVAVSIVLLALFLRTEEAREEDRRRAADTEWLDQTLHFHFRRLESDLSILALQARRHDLPGDPALRAGLLWRSPGVIAFHGWMPAGQQPFGGAWAPWQQAAAQHPDNAGALTTMLDTTRGLQRAAYAGPLLQPNGKPGQTVWLAAPLFEQGSFVGDYVAAIELDQALAHVVPAWFLKDHALRVAADVFEAGSREAENPSRYIVPISLPGAPWRLQVDVLNSQPSLTPRAFFGVALVCLVGMLMALYFLWRDTARRQRAESQLQTQMALRTAMERSITLGLRVWDLNGRLLYVNPAFCRMVGWGAQALIDHAGTPPYWPADQGDEFEWMQQQVELAREQQTGVEMPLHHRDGHTLEVLVHGAPLTLANGAVIGWLGSALDITERKRIERLAARQQEMLEASGRLVAVGEVASTLAHELNQPLGALSSFANGLLNRLQEGRITLDEITPVVVRMERMAEKAGRVIQRVNAFARRQEMTRQPLELTAFIKRVAGHVALPDGLTLRLRLPETELTLLADALLLEHALHNIVLNATEWAIHGEPAQAWVRISLEQTEAMAGIRVEDSGPGVPPDLQNRIFDAFSSQKAGGMGMGLSICRSIIEAHHGHIDLDRSAELNGAQFTLWLPLLP